mgnify:CR=1 FL=1
MAKIEDCPGFETFGADVKEARKAKNLARKDLAEKVNIDTRYLANIENKGQHPSVQVFLELVSRYHISVDQILYGNEAADKSTERRQFEILLDELTDAEIKILTATAQAILDARADSEGEN